MADTLITLENRLLLRCPAVGLLFARDLIKDSFREIAQRRDWAWRIKSGAIYPPNPSTPGTVSVTANSAVVTGSGTSFDSSLIGKQFRLYSSGAAYPTQTIIQVISSTSLVLDSVWTGPSTSGATYQLFQCYFPMPADFDHWDSLTNPTNAYKLWTNATQQILDRYDPQRVQYGPSWSAAFYDFQNEYAGTVGTVLQVNGSGPDPVATTTFGYSYPIASTYVITITTGGTVGTAEFTWRQDSGSSSAATVTSSDPIDLSNGVQVYFPAGTYVLGDVFVIPCAPASSQSVPRYEFWPRPNANVQYVYPFTYVSLIPDLTEDAPTLPPGLSNRGDVLLELALMKCAEYPGVRDVSNPYYDLTLAKRHEMRFERMINEMEQRDEEIATQNFMYTKLPFYPAPWMDGSFMQSHDISPY